MLLVMDVGNSNSAIGISPGVTISMEALVQRAAKLPKIELIKPDAIIGKNTVKAMQSGIFYGYVGLVELFSTESDSIQYVDPFLTLKGLQLIYDRNR